MGTTLSSIHIFSNSAPADFGFSFRSFSPNWQTCIEDFTKQGIANSRKAAKTISKRVEAPVVHFSMFDSDAVWFEVFYNGKIVSKMYDIPALVGCGEGQKRRLSAILGCADAELKTQMLEEYLGVCLLVFPELMGAPELLLRERDDAIYRGYQETEKALTGKTAPIKLKLVAEYPGKLFLKLPGDNTQKPHYFLYGFAAPNPLAEEVALVPVHFTGASLEPTELAVFEQGRVLADHRDDRFVLQYGTLDKVTFSEVCPEPYRGKTMTLPSGFFPGGFTGSGELLLYGEKRIFVVDASLKIVAKLSVKGEFADVVDDYILTAGAESFYMYEYAPGEKIRIYQMVSNKKL